jgi:hypothetical protein
MLKCNNIFMYNNNITSPRAIIMNMRSPYGIVGRLTSRNHATNGVNCYQVRLIIEFDNQNSHTVGSTIPYGILTTRSIFCHCILNPLMVNWPSLISTKWEGFPLSMVFWHPYPWYIDPYPCYIHSLSMVYQTPYPWYFDPPTHDISNSPLLVEMREVNLPP